MAFSQNHLSYECAGWLASHEGGPLYGRIKILEPNQPRFSIIKANSWVDYSRYWFSESGTYPTDCEQTDEEIFQEVENYFQAFVNVCNHREWADGEDRWSPNSRNKGLMQYHSTSRVLLDIYKTVWDKARLGCPDHIIPVKRFEEILAPLKWADWRNEDVLRRYQGSGERPRTSLRIWVETAIKHGKQYSREQVMSKTLKSKPRKRIACTAFDATIEIITPHEWPKKERRGSDSLLQSTRSRSQNKQVDHQRFERKDEEPSGGFKIQSGNEDISTLKIKWEQYLDDVDSLLIRSSGPTSATLMRRRDYSRRTRNFSNKTRDIRGFSSG